MLHPYSALRLRALGLPRSFYEENKKGDISALIKLLSGAGKEQEGRGRALGTVLRGALIKRTGLIRALEAQGM